MLKEAFLVHDYQEEAKLAKISRNDIFGEENATFRGTFASDCQDLTAIARLLVSIILYGPDLSIDIRKSQAFNTICKLLIHNAKKRKRKEEASCSCHTPKTEPPVPLYVGLAIHSQTQDKGLVEKLHKLGLSVSCKRVLQAENVLVQNLCKQFEDEMIVCPRNLCKGLYTVGPLDNIDHNPTSTSAAGSLHGTAISIM